MIHKAAVVQRVRRASARPIATTCVRRQNQTVACDLVELLHEQCAARQQLRRVAEETADLHYAFGRVFEPPGRSQIAFDPFPHHRLGDRPHVELRIERTGHALDHDHSFLQQQKLGAGAHVEHAGNLEQQHEQFRHRDFFGDPIVDRLTDRPDRLAKLATE